MPASQPILEFGQMGYVIKAHDWSASGLGPPELWPAALRLAVGMCLRSELLTTVYWGRDFRLFYNDPTIRLLGDKHPQALGRPAREVWADTWPELGPLYERVMSEGREVGGTNRRFSLDSNGQRTESYFSYSFAPIVEEDGNVGGIFAQARETTPVVLRERSLSADRQRLREMFEQAPGLFALLRGPEHAIEFLNPAAAALIGQRDTIGKPVREALPEIEAQGFVQLLDQAFSTGQAVSGTSMPASIDRAGDQPNDLRYLDLVFQPLTTADGTVDGILVQGMDVTERFTAAAALGESEERFRLIAEKAPVMLWMSDPNGKCLYLNTALRDFWSVRPEDVLSFDWNPTIHPDDVAPLAIPWMEGMQNRTGFTVEARYRRADGKYRVLHTTAQPRFGPGRSFLGMIGVNVDVTETRRIETALRDLNETLEARVTEEIAVRRQAEAALQQAQKMEAIGQLTGGVAHDFNNLLQVIGGNLQLLAKDVAGTERAEKRVSNALEGVRRGAKLASQLLAFGRRQALEPRAVNVGRLVVGLDEMLRRTLGESIEVETVIAGGLWNCLVDPSQIENAVLNLALNGRDAMPGGGRLTIEAGNASIDESYARTIPDATPGQFVLLAVTDTGTGIPPETLEHVFEPFFTTKAEGRGTGLGLSMVYGLVKQSGGHVRIYSEVGHGTTVKLYLPRVMAEEDPQRLPETGAVEGGQETILVAEDDEGVRETVVEILTELGYRVLKAKDAASALTVIESGAPVDLLFTDVVMPGPLKSPDLARRLRDSHPQIGVLFTSGYTQNAIVHDGKLDAGIELLPKPYTREDLARRIRRILGSRPLPPAAQPATAPSQAPARSALTILFVEDEAIIRLSTGELLRDMGHVVIEAGDGAEAARILETTAVDLLITDLALPGLPGSDVARRARELYPNVGLVIASGRVERTQTADLPGVVLLAKPYDDKALARAVAQATSRNSGNTDAETLQDM
ncbi:MAG TPA: response regulator [Devosia sp.]|nr:response regulator [Devosia sp.]